MHLFITVLVQALFMQIVLPKRIKISLMQIHRKPKHRSLWKFQSDLRHLEIELQAVRSTLLNYRTVYVWITFEIKFTLISSTKPIGLKFNKTYLYQRPNFLSNHGNDANDLKTFLWHFNPLNSHVKLCRIHCFFCVGLNILPNTFQDLNFVHKLCTIKAPRPELS